MSTARPTISASGAAPAWIVGAAAPLSSTIAVIRSIGSERKTGPVGGVSASFSARRSATGASSARRTSYDHFVNCSVSLTMSPERIGSSRSRRVSCWPAVTTIGERARLALWRIETPFATPGSTCRFTTPTWPEACA